MTQIMNLPYRIHLNQKISASFTVKSITMVSAVDENLEPLVPEESIKFLALTESNTTHARTEPSTRGRGKKHCRSTGS